MEVSTLGLPLMAQDHLDILKNKLLTLIQTQLLGREEGFFKDQVKISARQFYNNLLGYKPVTEVHLY
jgi:hypothetical protein